MSCGGCRSYAGAVAEGRLKSSATATGFLHLLRARPHHHSEGKPEFDGRRRTERVFGDSYRRAPTVRGARRQLRRTLGSRTGSPSNTACARRSAQLVDKSVDGGVSTCGDGGGHVAGHRPSPPPSPAPTARGLWTGESRQVILRAAPRVTRRRAPVTGRRLGSTSGHPAGMAVSASDPLSRAGRRDGGRGIPRTCDGGRQRRTRALSGLAASSRNATRGAGPESDAPRGEPRRTLTLG